MTCTLDFRVGERVLGAAAVQDLIGTGPRQRAFEARHGCDHRPGIGEVAHHSEGAHDVVALGRIERPHVADDELLMAWFPDPVKEGGA